MTAESDTTSVQPCTAIPYAAVISAVLSLDCDVGHNMRRAAAEGADTCVLGSISHVQQAHSADQSVPAALPTVCGVTSQQPSEPIMHSAVHSCDLVQACAHCLQSHSSTELHVHSMSDEAQHEAQGSKVGECTHLKNSHMHDGCHSLTDRTAENCTLDHHSSNVYSLQLQPCQQAAQPCSLQQEAQLAACDGAMLHTSASCVFPGAAVNEQSSKTSAHGSVWVTQGSLPPKTDRSMHTCTAPQANFQGKTHPNKRVLGGVALHKSVRRSLRHQAKAAAMV